MMQELLTLLPWIVNFFEFCVMAFIVLRVVTVLDHALARAQAPDGLTPLPAPPAPKPPIAPPKPAPTPASGAITPGLVAFVKKQEGFSAKAYWDYKQYTNGYGTKAASATETIDEATATQRLTAEIAAADHQITAKYPNLPLGQHQALLDLTYNAGFGWSEGSLGAAVAAQKIETIKADILLYNHAGGQVLPGLTARREAEVSWFDNPL